MADLQVIIPRPEEKPTKAPWQEEYFRQLEDKWDPPFQIPNIHFHYDKEDWFNRNLSIHAARDWKHSPFWFIIAMLFFGSDLAWTFIGLFLRFHY